tara:strand:- start:759 stop:938 length:180 start_codon:yes stop_codon:yes gene_type:complete
MHKDDLHMKKKMEKSARGKVTRAIAKGRDLGKPYVRYDEVVSKLEDGTGRLFTVAKLAK